jgi:hypothetical protein
LYADPAVFERSFAIELGYDDPSGFEGEGKGRKVITDVDVHKGLEGVMAQKYPRHFADVVNGEGDADIADMLMQILVHGKVVFDWMIPAR